MPCFVDGNHVNSCLFGYFIVCCLVDSIRGPRSAKCLMTCTKEFDAVLGDDAVGGCNKAAEQ